MQLANLVDVSVSERIADIKVWGKQVVLFSQFVPAKLNTTHEVKDIN